MATACIGLGANLGDHRGSLLSAVRRLRAEPGLRVLSVSQLYETAPLDCPPGSEPFLNAAIVVETNRPPLEVLQFLHRVEAGFGRERGLTNAPRALDLDLVLYDDVVIDSQELKLPHPRMHERAFVLVPLAEIAPDVIHPVLHCTVKELRDSIPAADVKPFQEPPHAGSQLRGLKALVTGSTSGIGLAIATAFRFEGAEVLTHGRSPRDDARHFPADLADPAQADRLANDAWNALGGLDIVVLNAGADTLTGDAAKWPFERKLDKLLEVDVKSTMRLARDLGARMKQRGRGSIITTGWDQAETGMDGDSGQLFAATKAAVMSFSRSLALSLAPDVRVNCLAPGWIRTAWGETASEYWQERARRETPLGIWGLPEDVAAAAVWLSSPAAAFISGQTIRVNGGAVR
ncbi:MAG: 2-amino-4-hydroxy-6-hydroxymethyldihydropteridine diphosphokinase [Gemmataceae bacterium]